MSVSRATSSASSMRSRASSRRPSCRETVLASGEFVQTSATQHPDLFWALRGGGGNFGVVTSFEYQLHPLGPQVLAGLVVYPLDQAKQVFEGYRKFIAAASEDMTVCGW
jgi:FAD/FMN-containing dehydrogenase